MRKGLSEALGRNPRLPSAHPGLLYERYAELACVRPARPEEDERGKVRPEDLEGLIKRVVGIGVPPVYRRAVQRWRASLDRSSAVTQEVEATSRLLIGHGNPAPGEVGMTLHPVYGTPLIPGSALKGLANHYLADWGAAADETNWHGVRYENGRPVGPPGKAHGILFGAPNLPRADGGEELGTRGAVVFEDAWLMPAGNEKPLIDDVLTPHQMRYYRDFGGEGPNDWTDPTPVSFLSVRPGTRFLVAVTAVGDGRRAAELALGHLLDALEQWGIGAKTAAGYGRLRRCDPSVDQPDDGPPSRRPRQEPPGPSSPALQALAEAVEAVLSPAGDNPPPLAQRFDGQDWKTLLAVLAAGEASQAKALLLKLNDHRGLRKRRSGEVEALLQELPK
jgi:CRISPR-associated protein Cmr6